MKNKKKKNIVNEVRAIIFLSIGLLIILSILSYNPSGTNFLGDHVGKDTNLIGEVGNRLADGILSLAGYGAYVIVFLLFYFAYISFSHIKRRNVTWVTYFSLTILIISVCPLLSIFFPDSLRQSAGGLIGHFIKNFLTTHTGAAGALIISLSLFLISLVLFTDFSINSAVKSAGGIITRIFQKTNISIARRTRVARIRSGIPQKGIALGKKPKTRIIITNGQKRKHGLPEIPAPGAAKTQQIKPEIPKQKPSISIGISKKKNAADIRDEREMYKKPRGKEQRRKEAGWRLPTVDLLDYKASITQVNEAALHQSTDDIVNKFKEFKINGVITKIHPGPVVTTYEFKPAPGIKYSKVISMNEDLCLALGAENIRMARMAGKSTIGIEVPNQTQQTIYLREIIDSDTFRDADSKLTISLGKTIVGKNCVTDLAKMPHLLMAGTTGSGKSVSINAMICSILFNATPEDVKFIMIDPKRLELGIYEDIPHLLTPVVTDPRLAAAALMWAVQEMNTRLEKLSRFSVRNIQQYNKLIKSKFSESSDDPDEDLRPLPYLVVVVDELSDLMIVSSAKVEESITRLSQMARAVGIHLIVATQRPSVDVITGIIKANMPSRISFRVFSKIDSRTILDSQGADKLLGRGDMLFIPPGSAAQVRVHGAFVTEPEIENVIKFWKKQGRPLYADGLEEKFEAVAEAAFRKKSKSGLFDDIDGDMDDDEALYDLAKRIVISTRKSSTSNLQRKLKIGYNRAARIMDMMEEEGIVGPAEGSKPRTIIVSEDYLDT